MEKFKELFLNNLEAEIIQFRKEMLSKSPQSVYESAHKIHFYEFAYDWLVEENLTKKEYAGITKTTKHLLSNLYNKALKWDNFSFDLLDATLLLDDYLDGFLAHPNELEM